ncbi:zinc ribbon domain-containing protein, partial [Streptococcus suis]
AYTTQTCSSCGSRCSSPKGRTGLGIREWQCMECGTFHDRDINSALNILALGHERLAVGIPVLYVAEDVKFRCAYLSILMSQVTQRPIRRLDRK